LAKGLVVGLRGGAYSPFEPALVAALAGSEAAARMRKLRRLIAAIAYRFNRLSFRHRRGLRHGMPAKQLNVLLCLTIHLNRR
jgi:hypothetical protein